MPDEDEKNLTASPESDSVLPGGEEASTVVTEFPQHLIDALAQSAGLASGPPAPAAGLPEENPRPTTPASISPWATVEVPAVVVDLDPPNPRPPLGSSPNERSVPPADKPGGPAARKPVAASGGPAAPKPATAGLMNVPDARAPLTTLPLLDLQTPATGSPRFEEDNGSDIELEEELELEESLLEPYESPSDHQASPRPAPFAKGTPLPERAPAPVEIGTETLLDPMPPFSIPGIPSMRGAAQTAPPPFAAASSSREGARPASVPAPAPAPGAPRPAAVWAEPPPPVVLMDQPSALGWAIGGIIVGLLLLALLVWLLVVLVRHLT